MVRCSIVLVKGQFILPILTLTVLIDPEIQVRTGMLVYPILLDTEDHSGGGLEVDLRVSDRAR